MFENLAICFQYHITIFRILFLYNFFHPGSLSSYYNAILKKEFFFFFLILFYCKYYFHVRSTVVYFFSLTCATGMTNQWKILGNSSSLCVHIYTHPRHHVITFIVDIKALKYTGFPQTLLCNPGVLTDIVILHGSTILVVWLKNLMCIYTQKKK